jgi:hypothetical protein
MKEYVIYSLVDPQEDYKVCYVGMTDDVYNRFRGHLADIDKSTLKGQWLPSLRDKHCVPRMKTLEVVSSIEEAREREAYWIHFYKQLRMPLTNATIPQLPTTETTEAHVKEIEALLGVNTEAEDSFPVSTEEISDEIVAINQPVQERRALDSFIRATIKRMRKKGMPHREIAQLVGLAGDKYKTYRAVCQQEGVQIESE